MNFLRTNGKVPVSTGPNPFVEQPIPQSHKVRKTFKAELSVPASLHYPGFLSEAIPSFVSFMYKNRNLACFGSWHPEDQINWMLVMGDSFSFANSGSLLEDFVLEKKRDVGSRFDSKTMNRLDCFLIDKDGVLSIYDRSDGLMEKPLKKYKYVDEDVDAQEYYNFVVSRTRDCLLKFVKGYETDNSLDKYRRKLVLDPVVGEKSLGIATLAALRNIRGTENSTEKLIKTAMVTTAGRPFTPDKFFYRTREMDSNPGGLVLHYGSGSVKAKSRFVYDNVACIDPLWDGEGGFKGTHEDFHSAIVEGTSSFELPTLVTSDACAYGETPTELSVKRTQTGRARSVRSMDVSGTNFLAADIVRFWRGRGYKGSFVMKLGVAEKLPLPLRDMKGVLVMKQRPANAEIIVHIGDPAHTTPLVDVVREANGPMLLGNYQRLKHVMDGSFPEGKLAYSPVLDIVLKKSRMPSSFKKPDKYGFQDRVRMTDIREAIRNFDLDGAQHLGNADVEHTLKLFQAAKYVGDGGGAEVDLVRPSSEAFVSMQNIKAERRRAHREQR